MVKNQYRLPQDEDGLTLLDLMEEADVLVLGAVTFLTETELHELDSFVARRAHGAPRITIVRVDDKEHALPQSQEIYGEGRHAWLEMKANS